MLFVKRNRFEIVTLRFKYCHSCTCARSANNLARRKSFRCSSIFFPKLLPANCGSQFLFRNCLLQVAAVNFYSEIVSCKLRQSIFVPKLLPANCGSQFLFRNYFLQTAAVNFYSEIASCKLRESIFVPKLLSASCGSQFLLLRCSYTARIHFVYWLYIPCFMQKGAFA